MKRSSTRSGPSCSGFWDTVRNKLDGPWDDGSDGRWQHDGATNRKRLPLWEWPSGGSLFTFWKNKRKSTKHFCLVLFVVHLQGLEPWAHWLREQAAGSSQFMEVSSHRYFYTKQRDFSPSNFCTLCRILQRKAPSARFETVQKPCRNRALTPKQTNLDLSPTDLTALVWVTEHQNQVMEARILSNPFSFHCIIGITGIPQHLFYSGFFYWNPDSKSPLWVCNAYPCFIFS